MWGLRNSQALGLFFDTFADPRAPLWQFGPGTNMISTVEAGNCARAHILAAQALLKPDPDPGSGPGTGPDSRVDGEAFNVTDGLDVNFWADTRATSALIRDGHHHHHPRDDGAAAAGADLSSSSPVDRTKVHIVPAWAMALAVLLARWLYLILTLGRVEPPPALRRKRTELVHREAHAGRHQGEGQAGVPPRASRQGGAEGRAVAWERERRRLLLLASGVGAREGQKEE